MKSLSYIPASDGSGDASLMTITQVRIAPATSITVNTVAGVPSKFFATMGTPHTFSDPVTGETITIISEATAVSFAGRVDSGKIEIDAIADGETDLGSKVGDVILIRPTTQWADNLYNVLSESLDDDGTLKDKSVTLPKINGGSIAGVLATDASGNVSALQVLGAWTSYTPATVGWAATPTTSSTAYMQIGKTVFYRFIVSGTSNGTSARVALPVEARNDNSRNTEGALGLAQNNGTFLTTACRMYIEPSSSTTQVICSTNMSDGTWVGSGAKTVRGMIVYEAA